MCWECVLDPARIGNLQGAKAVQCWLSDGKVALSEPSD